MKVLMIGGSGWVGHNIAMSLAAMGDEVTILSRGQREFPAGVAQFATITGDKNDESFMAETLQSHSYDAVIDSVPAVQAIQWLSKYRRFYGRYLHCSSVGVYTPVDQVPGDESLPIARKTYGGFEGKVATDKLALELTKTGDLTSTILRPCCILGEGKLPLDNQGGRREDFLSDIAAGKTIDLLDDGKALLQLINVADLGRAFAQATHCADSVNRVYNICGDYAVPVRRYCELIATAMGKPFVYRSLSFEEMIQAHGEEIRSGLAFLAENMCFKNELARRELRFVPQYTLEQNIRQTVQWCLRSGQKF